MTAHILNYQLSTVLGILRHCQTCITSRRVGDDGAVLPQADVDLVRRQRRRDEPGPAQHRRRLIVAAVLLLLVLMMLMVAGNSPGKEGEGGEREEAGVAAVRDTVLESADRRLQIRVGRRLGREERRWLQILRGLEKGCSRLYHRYHGSYFTV